MPPHLEVPKNPTGTNVRVVDHPLVQEGLATLRQKDTPPGEFHEHTARLAALLAYEATRDLGTRPKPVTTPLEEMRAEVLDEPPPILVPILRAGLGMLEGARRILPSAPVGHVGMERNEDSLLPETYCVRLPETAPGQRHLILDPMLATGGSADAAIQVLRHHGATSLTLIAIVAAPEGAALLETEHPDVGIITAAVDRELSSEGFILPGLGDAGNRMFGT